jgi:hypothetical protein
MQTGASNLENGVTIDLQNINGIQVSDDRSTTKVGPGVKLGDLYEMLDGLGLSVISGRDSNVGVGGITLGGMVSLHKSDLVADKLEAVYPSSPRGTAMRVTTCSTSRYSLLSQFGQKTSVC